MRFVKSHLLSMAVLCATPAMADGTRVEITPFAGYLAGGSLSVPIGTDDEEELDIQAAADYGAFLDFRLGQGGAVGVMYLRQDSAIDSNPAIGLEETDLRTEFYHFEGFYEFDDGNARPFVVASLGITRFEVEHFSPDTRFSWSLGGGVRFFFGKHFGLRLEGRYLGTLVDRDQEEICADDDGDFCLRYYDDTVLNQFDAKLGLIFAF